MKSSLKVFAVNPDNSLEVIENEYDYDDEYGAFNIIRDDIINDGFAYLCPSKLREDIWRASEDTNVEWNLRTNKIAESLGNSCNGVCVFFKINKSDEFDAIYNKDFVSLDDEDIACLSVFAIRRQSSGMIQDTLRNSMRWMDRIRIKTGKKRMPVWSNFGRRCMVSRIPIRSCLWIT